MLFYNDPAVSGTLFCICPSDTGHRMIIICNLSTYTLLFCCPQPLLLPLIKMLGFTDFPM